MGPLSVCLKNEPLVRKGEVRQLNTSDAAAKGNQIELVLISLLDWLYLVCLPLLVSSMPE